MSNSASEVIIENSKVGLPVPVIDGCYLHSRFNPLKEAEEFMLENIEKVKGKNTIIILGLGFGYHVNELVKVLTQAMDDFKILIIEQNKPLVDKFNEIFSFDDPRVEIVCHESVEDFFFDKKVIDFFQTKPAVLTHKPSFNLNKEFYTKFLTYKAPKEVSLYAEKIENEELAKYFKNQTGSLEDIIKEKAQSLKVEDKNDFLVQLIGELR